MFSVHGRVGDEIKLYKRKVIGLAVVLGLIMACVIVGVALIVRRKLKDRKTHPPIKVKQTHQSRQPGSDYWVVLDRVQRWWLQHFLFPEHHDVYNRGKVINCYLYTLLEQYVLKIISSFVDCVGKRPEIHLYDYCCRTCQSPSTFSLLEISQTIQQTFSIVYTSELDWRFFCRMELDCNTSYL